MRIVNVTYHQEAQGWWAESVDAPSFFATGKNRDEVRQRTQETLPRILGVEAIELREAEFTGGPVLEPVEHPGEWRQQLEGVALEWLGQTAASDTSGAA